MLQRGDSAPQFHVTTPDGKAASYATIWQRSNLVLIVLPNVDSAATRAYLARLATHEAAFRNLAAECVVTRDPVLGVPVPGALVTDRWGEIVHVAGGPTSAEPPDPEELIEWLQYVQNRCPECEGESK